MSCFRLAPAAAGLLLFSAAGVQAAETMHFRDACRAGERILVAAVGDLLFHQSLQQQALAPNGKYARFWQAVAPVLAGADLTYGNLEGPAAEGVSAGGTAVKDPGRRLDGRVYGTTPGALIFNYHPSVVEEVKESGFAVVSTANNHAADRGSLGIDRTVAALDRAGLKFTGTRAKDETGRAWSVVTEAKGMKVAWLACTYSTNGNPDRHNQVLNCYRDKETVLGEVRRLAADPAVDAVIVTPHWGIENSQTPQKGDRAYAREMVEAGAAAVIGAHPHVLQPWEKIVAADGREALAVYSLGNFVSNQPSPLQRSGLIALVELTRGQGRKAEVSAAGFIPTWVDRASGHRVVEMKAGAREHAGPLAATLRLLPAGNRVAMEKFRQLTRQCTEPVEVASAEPPPAASVDRSAAVATEAVAVATARPVQPQAEARSVSATADVVVAQAAPAADRAEARGAIVQEPPAIDAPASAAPADIPSVVVAEAREAVVSLAATDVTGEAPPAAAMRALLRAALTNDPAPLPVPRAEPVMRTRRRRIEPVADIGRLDAPQPAPAPAKPQSAPQPAKAAATKKTRAKPPRAQSRKGKKKRRRK